MWFATEITPEGLADGDQSAAAEKREAILAAAVSAIVAGGVAAVRVEQVAADAGVSAALLYYHFDSRSGLVKAALERAVERAPSATLAKPSAFDSGYRAVIEALMAELDEESAVRDNAVVWGEVSAAAVFDPDFRDDVRRATESWTANVADGIDVGIADGSISDDVDPSKTAELVVSIVEGLCNRWLSGAMDLDRAREVLSDALERLLAVDHPGS